MEKMNLEDWNEERYKDLNTYFRIRIEQLLKQDEQLRDQMESGVDLELKDIIKQMGEEDKERWDEFILLDKLKLQVDVWNHLHGIGTPFKPGTGFHRPEDSTW